MTAPHDIPPTALSLAPRAPAAGGGRCGSRLLGEVSGRDAAEWPESSLHADASAAAASARGKPTCAPQKYRHSLRWGCARGLVGPWLRREAWARSRVMDGLSK
jgi:hypothetical protein